MLFVLRSPCSACLFGKTQNRSQFRGADIWVLINDSFGPKMTMGNFSHVVGAFPHGHPVFSGPFDQALSVSDTSLYCLDRVRFMWWTPRLFCRCSSLVELTNPTFAETNGVWPKANRKTPSGGTNQAMPEELFPLLQLTC